MLNSTPTLTLNALPTTTSSPHIFSTPIAYRTNHHTTWQYQLALTTD